VPFEGDQQIDPPGVGYHVRVEQQQRRHIVRAGQSGGQFGGDRVGGGEHVDLRDGRRMLEHMCESNSGQQRCLPLFRREIPAKAEAGSASREPRKAPPSLPF
jgi:hypothetical protein